MDRDLPRQFGRSETLDRALDGGPFDLIFSTGTLHHLPPTDLRHALRELRTRAHPRRGVLLASFHKFAAASVVPRAGGSSRIRGLTPPAVRQLLDGDAAQSARDGATGGRENSGVHRALHALLRRMDEPLVNRIFSPSSDLPPEYRSRLLNGLLDEESTEDDGGGLGACITTGSEHLGIPGRYERHYLPRPLTALFEAAGWRVKECRDNTAEETGRGTEGQLIYIVAMPNGNGQGAARRGVE
jgi:hypothetical protein